MRSMPGVPYRNRKSLVYKDLRFLLFARCQFIDRFRAWMSVSTAYLSTVKVTVQSSAADLLKAAVKGPALVPEA